MFRRLIPSKPLVNLRYIHSSRPSLSLSVSDISEIDPHAIEFVDQFMKGVKAPLTSYHLGRPIDLTKINSLFTGSSTSSNTDYVNVVIDESSQSGFDVYRFGSVVFYNTSNEQQAETTTKLLKLDVDASSAPYQMEGYDKHEVLLELPFDEYKFMEYDLREKPLETLHAVGSLLARNCALQFYDAALDRVIDGIFTLNEEELRGHVSYITNCVNSIKVFEESKFIAPSANALYALAKSDLQPESLYSEFHFKQAVLRNQYNISGAPELNATVAKV